MKKIHRADLLRQFRNLWRKRRKQKKDLAKALRSVRRTLRKLPGERQTQLTRIVAPENFSLTRGDGGRVDALLRMVEGVVLGSSRPVRIDFRKTKRLYVPGALLLYAGLDSVLRRCINVERPIRIIPPTSSRAQQVMKQIGIFDLCGLSSPVQPTRNDVIYWRLATGSTQSGDELQILDVIADRVNRGDAENVQKSGLWRGVSEAVNNAHEHGYKRPRADGSGDIGPPRWWLLTQIRDQTFTAAVCDLGCGYAATLDSEIMEWFKGIIPRLRAVENGDTQAIQAAMEYGRSSTRKSERGRGSRDALALLERHGDGDLYVLSNSGYVRYSCKQNNVVVRSVSPLDFSVRGTIIWWNLRLRSTP